MGYCDFGVSLGESFSPRLNFITNYELYPKKPSIYR